MDLNSPICRVCMHNSMELVDLEAEIEHESAITVLESFNFCTQLNALKEDELPKHLCTGCSEELRNAFDFIRRAQEADTILRCKIEENSEETEYVLVETIDGEDELLPQKSIEIKLEDNNEIISVLYTGDRQKPEDEEKSVTKNESLKIECLERDEMNLDREQDIEVNEIRINKCDTLLNSQSSLEGHLKKERAVKKLLCSICGKICSSRYTLDTHLLKHRGKKPHSCQQCSRRYFTKHGLHLHIMSAHSDIKSPKYLCSVCGKEFATKQRLEVHHLTHTGEKKFCCTFCEKKFPTPFRLKSHLRIHTGEKPYECTICGVKFAQGNALKCHKRTHTGEKPYECKICGKCFNQNTILKTHMTLHTGKTVKCPLCDKKFSRSSCLILHQREHTGEKPYACYKCPNKYKQKSHLDRHLDTHFGIKHRCSICSKEYSKRSSLKIHMFEHTEDKPFQCSDCFAKFTRKDKYKAHLKKVHNKILVKDELGAEIVKLNYGTETMSRNHEILIEVQDSNDDPDEIVGE